MSKLKLSHLVIIFMLITMISGCSTINQNSSPVLISSNPKMSWKQHRDQLSNLNHWKLSGVIGIVSNHQGESANFQWDQSKGLFNIEISGPLGIGAIYLKGNKNKTTLISSKGKHYTANNPEELMYTQMGWYVPITGLSFWVKGIPIPNQPAKKKLNNLGLISTLYQNGWEINYDNYILVNKKYPLPRKIIMIGNGLKIKLINKKWSIN
jgi:outer membrane lipoprotein LolB